MDDKPFKSSLRIAVFRYAASDQIFFLQCILKYEVLRYAVLAVLRCVGSRLLTPFLFQITHVHHVRAFINQPVRTDQEEQVPGVFSAASAQVCPQPAPVSGHSVQKQNNPLWYEAGERATQAAGPVRNQGRNLSFSMQLPACLSTLWNQSWPI